MDISDIVAQLKKEFLDSFPEKILLIQNQLKTMDYKNLEMEFHKFKGIGSTYGMPEISEMGLVIESLVKLKHANCKPAIEGAIKILNLIHSKTYEISKSEVISELNKIKSY